MCFPWPRVLKITTSSYWAASFSSPQIFQNPVPTFEPFKIAFPTQDVWFEASKCPKVRSDDGCFFLLSSGANISSRAAFSLLRYTKILLQSRAVQEMVDLWTLSVRSQELIRHGFLPLLQSIYQLVGKSYSGSNISIRSTNSQCSQLMSGVCSLVSRRSNDAERICVFSSFFFSAHISFRAAIFLLE